MRSSKYLNKTFDNGWTITHVGVASVQPKFLLGTRIPRKSPGHQNYYYIAERTTSDHKADKMVRLSAKEMVAVRKGLTTIESIATSRTTANNFTTKVSYHFYSPKTKTRR